MRHEDREAMRGFPWTPNDHRRVALTQEVARMREAGACGNDIRQRFGAEITGPARRKLLREIGREDLIQKMGGKRAPGSTWRVGPDGHRRWYGPGGDR
jgi:hypothetical protein